MRFGQTIFYNMQKLYLTWGGHFTSAFLHIFVKFMEKELSAKFYGVLIIFQKLMKFRSWVELEFSDVIPANVHNMRFSAAYNALGQELVSFRSSENTYFCCSWLLLCVCPVRSWYMLENLIYDEQKWQVVKRFTTVTQLEKLLTKYHIFHSLTQKIRGSEQKYGLRTLLLGIT